MAVISDLGFNQISTILNDVVSQATGRKAIAPINTEEFMSVATTALKVGYDPIINAVSQVLARTIFSVRPYYRKFKGLYVSEQKFGNHVRKINYVDGEFEDDGRFMLVDGQSVDHYVVNKPQVVQTNFYGEKVYERSVTIFKDQLDSAFSSPDQFAQFISGVLQNISDQIEQAHENTARLTITNYIASKKASDGTNVISLRERYNAETSQELTAEQIMLPENYESFVRWMFGFIKTISDKMTERSSAFHNALTGKVINRHTPVRDQRLYLYSPMMNAIATQVMSQTFNPNYLKLIDYESVNFWQAFNNPDAINLTPSFMAADGSITQPSAPVSMSNVVGVLMDRETAGITTINKWQMATPMNAKGGYTNTFWHFTDRYWNDFTENGVIFTL